MELSGAVALRRVGIDTRMLATASDSNERLGVRETSEVQRVDVCVTAIVCDKCGKRITADDWVEWQEAFQFSGCGGYGSKFGDSCPFTLDLCEECWHGLVGGLVKYRDDENEVEVDA